MTEDRAKHLLDVLPARYWDVDHFPEGASTDRPWSNFADWLVVECDVPEFRKEHVEVLMPHIYGLYHERATLDFQYRQKSETVSDLRKANLRRAAKGLDISRPHRGNPPHHADPIAIECIWIMLGIICGNSLSEISPYACKRDTRSDGSKYDSKIEKIYRQFLLIADPKRLQRGANPTFPSASIFEKGYRAFEKGRFMRQRN